MYIRSQDKRHFGIYTNLDIVVFPEDVDGKTKSFIQTGRITLGEYANEERCIEIVDGISNIIERQYSLTQEKADAEAHLVHMRFVPEKAVYQMPKE